MSVNVYSRQYRYQYSITLLILTVSRLHLRLLENNYRLSIVPPCQSLYLHTCIKPLNETNDDLLLNFIKARLKNIISESLLY